VVINRDPMANLLKKALFSFANRPTLELIRARLQNAGRVRSPAGALSEAFGVAPADLKAKFHNVERHLAHLASAFLVARPSSVPRSPRSTASAISPAPCGAPARAWSR
jgi:carbamoyltransferase